tara:strand:- start:363 stop:560 length:198 start_codon:yes stop_codon:yes gene_type:complete
MERQYILSYHQVRFHHLNHYLVRFYVLLVAVVLAVPAVGVVLEDLEHSPQQYQQHLIQLLWVLEV